MEPHLLLLQCHRGDGDGGVDDDDGDGGVDDDDDDGGVDEHCY